MPVYLFLVHGPSIGSYYREFTCCAGERSSVRRTNSLYRTNIKVPLREYVRLEPTSGSVRLTAHYSLILEPLLGTYSYGSTGPEQRLMNGPLTIENGSLRGVSLMAFEPSARSRTGSRLTGYCLSLTRSCRKMIVND